VTDTPQPPVQAAAPAAAAPAGGLAPHRGTTILIFGIIGLVCCLIFGILAWVMGKKDLEEMAAGRMDPAGQGLTNAGRICGMVSVILATVGFVIWLIMLIAGLAASA